MKYIFERNKAGDGLVLTKAERTQSAQPEKSIVIPAKEGELPVTAIGDGAFRGMEDLESVTIPGSVKIIGKGAFSSNRHLKEVVLEKGIKCIGIEAFMQCGELECITIPASVRIIGFRAFQNCDSLKKICYSGWSEQWEKLAAEHKPLQHVEVVFIENDSDDPDAKLMQTWKDEYGERYQVIQDEQGALFSKDRKTLFQAPEGVEEYVIPQGTKILHRYAFRTCLQIKKVVIPDSVHIIGSSAFEGCRLLKSVSLPNYLNTIGNGAFCRCESLESITIPQTVSHIKDWAFWGCTNMKTACIYGLKDDVGVNVFSRDTKVDIIVDGQPLLIGGVRVRLMCDDIGWDWVSYYGHVYEDKANGFGKVVYNDYYGTEHVTHEGYWRDGNLVSGRGLVANGHLYESDKWWHKRTDEEMEKLMR